ncbi:MAG TPA: putative quinol monooxygenase [Pirellulales bacterium]|nr:putative quinol monooxygenase [Pirellulales bacterium]
MELRHEHYIDSHRLSMIHVIATITVAEGKRDVFLSHFRALVPKVLAEKGCIEYGPTIDVETEIPGQPAARSDVVTVVERWKDIAALEAHLMAPHMLEYRAIVKDLMRGAELRVLKPA